MKVLAVETSTPSGSVALVSHPEGSPSMSILGEIAVHSEKSHSERLLSSVDFLLTSCGVDISEIDFFAASIGPGSFTGLRIGLSTIKAFAFAHGKKVVGVPTLEAMTLSGLFHSGPICSFLDAGRGELYAALYSSHSRESGNPLLPLSLQKSGDLMFKLKEFQRQCYSENQPKSHPEGRFKGHPEGHGHAWRRPEGSPAAPEKILLLGDLSLFEEKHLDSQFFKWSDSFSPSPRALSVAQLAIRKIEEGNVIDPLQLVPLYIRIPQAEANLRQLNEG